MKIPIRALVMRWNYGEQLVLWSIPVFITSVGLARKRSTILVSNTPNAEYDCIKAIERYIAMPGQATAYMIGKLKILEAEGNARDVLGDDFDIRVFHDTVLGSGPVLLSKLADNIEAMIEAEKG